MRERFLKGLVWFGAVLFVSTELLSIFSSVTRVPLVLFWSVAAGFAVYRLTRNPPVLHWRGFDPVVLVCVTVSLVILALTAVTAAFSPPNSSDAMAYHMPRVVYWAEQGSIRFFPTQYFNQIMLQPFAEYLMLHTYVLSGGDRLVNFVQWFASLASVIGVSCAARLLGSKARGQALAALFCATIPSGILASSGAKNDYFLAMWLIVAVCFALRFRGSGSTSDALYMGASAGFALLTKGTAYLFLPWPLLAILAPRKKLLFAVALALAVNAPQYVRNYDLSGSIMGFDSAQGDGFFRWRNERFGWRETASNFIRNTSDQLGARSKAWNEGVYRTDLALHKAIGIDVNDPATTWRWTTFGPPINANHEANAPNRWHLAIFVVLFFFLRDRRRAMYAASLIAGFIAFCAYLKWQPNFSRLQLPLFVLAAPLAGIVEKAGRRGIAQIAFCLLLLDNARAPALENWVRPLKGPRSVLHVPRDQQYFSDLSQWNNRESFLETVDLLKNSHCDTVGIDITRLQIEYPIEALFHGRFLHAGVENASSHYRQPVPEKACAVVCLDCLGDTGHLALYGDYPNSREIGKFVVLTKASIADTDPSRK